MIKNTQFAISALIVMTLSSVKVSADTFPTCKIPPAGLDNFTLEHKIDLSAVHSSFTATLPKSISDEVFVNGKEIHSRLSYNKGNYSACKNTA